MEFEAAMDLLYRPDRKDLAKWRTRLDSADSMSAVIWIVKDFVASWAPGELAALPIDCRPGRMNDADDVTFLAYRLVREQLQARGEQRELHSMAHFFSLASTRLASLLAQPQGTIAANEARAA